MQFSLVSVFAVMASVVAAENAYAGVAYPSGAVTTPSPVASTGVGSAPSPTGSPIVFSGDASFNGVSALGMIVAGGFALFL
ncbi:uncharacterized protein L3040_009245 [Drepanopeziza brunnea f. sp. 'multigermtubi']|uniref:Uncharacterized protein n=1 Tax=Marssonina brunnea f. sp. multigermtubi (strain MB_m1) TaxID=1072389 RepID=K1Y2D2_MARBU|nr:uncharacterized protein MBM_02551 [Drepanopeziza brunnea f. sp. 'multigermtubi' MB_m1]EKD19314.1 hypothetical protein MBM_02551 [Drepanopeziza brunnea f. sp. 'multigermtubi' MB_m1]KAJ5032649.1 hypothetical protein L3040_009245 [Drepanopeziza brunnea f. sp. 'multigermtubi']